MHPDGTRTSHARNCGVARAPAAAVAAAAVVAGMLLLLLLLLLHPNPLEDYWRTQISRGHIRAHGGSNPVVPSFHAPPCAHNSGTRALATAWCPGLGQTIRSSLSASRAGDAQRAAKHGQQAKGSGTKRSARQGK
eukprot:6924358-Prymnesium_polylepis.1